jgi:MazG family protein
MNAPDDAGAAFREFVAVIKALRTPVTGCPWDLEQDHRSLRPYLIEETYEVLDAIDRNSDGELKEELGDLLLQIVLHAQIADDRKAFCITDVLRGIIDKMVRRHPHVFADAKVQGTADVLKNWETIKSAEKGHRTPREPLAVPALMRAQRLARKQPAASETELRRRLHQHLAGLEAAPRETLGPLLLDLCRWAENAGISAEDALRETITNVPQGQGSPHS